MQAQYGFTVVCHSGRGSNWLTAKIIFNKLIAMLVLTITALLSTFQYEM